jgi:hypothetical protein
MLARYTRRPLGLCRSLSPFAPKKRITNEEEEHQEEPMRKEEEH